MSYPDLHPDGYDEPDSGWPHRLKPFTAEAWTRAEAGELADEELDPCKAQWCGIFDRMDRAPTAEETERQVCAAARHGLAAA